MEISKEEYDALRLYAYKYGGCPSCRNMICDGALKRFTCALDGHDLWEFPKDRVCVDGSEFQIKLK